MGKKKDGAETLRITGVRKAATLVDAIDSSSS